MRPHQTRHSATRVAIGATLAMLAGSGSARADEPGQVSAIVAACAKGAATCMAQFNLYSRIDEETNLKASASILTFFKASDQTFSGRAEELYYTEIPIDGIQYQIGYGYVVAAHQQDAKPTGSGSVSGVDVSGSADVGNTLFAASVIGIAPDDADCKATSVPVNQGLLCAVDIQPTVTQDYFKAELGRLSGAFAKWNSAAQAAAATETICPQIINYRLADRTKVGTAVELTDAQRQDLHQLRLSLTKACAVSRPNAHVSYKNGPQMRNVNVQVTVAGAADSYARSLVSQGYYRNRYYLADTPLRTPDYYAPDDHYAEVYVDGVNAAASLPSLLAAIITLNTTVQNQRIHALTQCSGGARSINLSPFSGSTADPVNAAKAYGDFVDGIRKATDSAPGSCT